MLWVLLPVVVLIWALQQRWLTRRQAALARKLTTKLKALPVLGHTYMLLTGDEERMRVFEVIGRDSIEAGGISKFLHFNQLLISVADPVVAEVLLSQCLEKHNIYEVLAFLLGDASIVAPVHIWRHRRKINAPVFNTKNLARFSSIFAKQSIALADLLEKEADKGTFSCWEYIAGYGMSTVCENIMGVKSDAETLKFTVGVKKMFELASFVVCQPWLGTVIPLLALYHNAYKIRTNIWNFITKTIQDKQKQIKNKTNQTEVLEAIKKYQSSYLEIQLQTAKITRKFTEQELFEESILLVGAAYDTSATASVFTILMMGRYPDIQDKVYEELQAVFGDSDRPAVYEDLLQLNYLEAVIKETMRLYPPVPVIIRQADKDVELPSGLTIVKGCGILLNIWAVHRNPEYWGEDADQFRPDRFLNYAPKHPAAFMPFSYGPRNCIGYRFAMTSMKTMLSTLLRRYRVAAPPGVAPGAPLSTKFHLIMKHVDNYETRLERRK